MGLDDTGLNLGLGFAVPPPAAAAAFGRKTAAAASSLEPSLTLGISSSSAGDDQEYSGHGSTKMYGRLDSPTTTSFSNGSLNRPSDDDDGEEDDIIIINNNNINNNNNSRKKLRLNRDQSALLEQCFKQHSTLNPKQKQELARKLNLRPRQVEVWFQNRRARTKLKQTEINCEFLKKCCETLTDENRRLQKELHELKSLKLPGLYMQLPATTLSICPACERIGTAVGEGEVKDSDKNISMVGSKPTHLYNPIVNPSTAC
ncbi:homeobox-leucine zipper protein HAT22-like [Impatiens glandulifera]|uniref:homeobox-leucine zipper protein HAT22-like n=1 Tax=Impatiens glandulifera TaxID=253017 RepID=UPI001FB0BBBD|nr:homeobox-leucine zipper protein HAT22-like [Impatiens glandulifera]